jgi:predicted SAM-dependent methyltransferase
VTSTLRNLLLFLFSHRLLAIARWDLHFLRVRLQNALEFQRRRLRKLLASRKGPLFLNLGSGPRGIEDAHWVNVDGFHDRNVHHLIDFTRPLPFESESFDGVFCEHVLEHFSLQDGQELMGEVRRILRPGGCVRIVVPDAELILQRYLASPGKLISRRGSGTETAMEIVNLYFRQRYEHQFLYDWTTMNKMLMLDGFREAFRASFGRGQLCRAIILDDEKYEWESLYVEAMKPKLNKERNEIFDSFEMRALLAKV